MTSSCLWVVWFGANQFIFTQGLSALSCKKSYRMISRTLEAARLDVRNTISLWNLTRGSTGLLPSVLLKLKRLGKSKPESRFETLRDVKIRRPSAWWIRLFYRHWAHYQIALVRKGWGIHGQNKSQVFIRNIDITENIYHELYSITARLNLILIYNRFVLCIIQIEQSKHLHI